jgi:rubrerythrin
MDFLLYFYYLVFGIILISPFLLFYYRYSEDMSPFGEDIDRNVMPLLEKKRNLLDSLKDVRSDFDSGKLTEEEFQSQSIPYIEELEQLEENLSQLRLKQVNEATTSKVTQIKGFQPWVCASCGFSIPIPNAKYCPNCGVTLIA